MAYAEDFEKALQVGRPPTIQALFPNSKALIVSGKVVDRAMRAKGKAIAMALPLARIARSTTLPLTISALEFGNRAWMVGGRPTWRAFSKSSAYAMEGLLQGVVDSPPRIVVRIRSGSKHDRTHGARCCAGALLAVWCVYGHGDCGRHAGGDVRGSFHRPHRGGRRARPHRPAAAAARGGAHPPQSAAAAERPPRPRRRGHLASR